MSHYLISESETISQLSDADWIECNTLALKVCEYNDCIWVTTQRPDWKEILVSAQRICGNLALLSHNLLITEMELAFSVGARAYCSVMSDTDELNTVSTVLQAGGIWIPAALLASKKMTVPRAINVDTTLSYLSTLTGREKDVLNCILHGQANKEIAKSLNITERTVKEFVGSLLNKCKVKDRVGLLLKIGNFNHLKGFL